MQDENRCLKFTGYIYLPDSDADHKILRKHSAKTMGRIMIYDEKNNPKLNRMEAFDNVGTMLGRRHKPRDRVADLRDRRRRRDP